MRRIKEFSFRMQIKMNNFWRIILNIVLEGLIVIIGCSLLNTFQRFVCSDLWNMEFVENIMEIIEPRTIFEQQLSLSFIILTLTAILSSNLKTILWTNQIEFNLKKPVFLGFIGYTSRIISNFVLTCVFIGLKSKFLYVNFLIFLITLIIFMYRLISINYDEDGCRRKIIMYFDWIKKVAADEDLKKVEYENNRKDFIVEYENIKKDFIVESCKYVEENNIMNFKENILFLKEREEYETIVNILRLVSMRSLFYLCTIIDDLKDCVAEIQKVSNANEITKIVSKNAQDNRTLKEQCRKLFGE